LQNTVSLINGTELYMFMWQDCLGCWVLCISLTLCLEEKAAFDDMAKTECISTLKTSKKQFSTVMSTSVNISSLLFFFSQQPFITMMPGEWMSFLYKSETLCTS
jgi:hypothetical protein